MASNTPPRTPGGRGRGRGATPIGGNRPGQILNSNTPANVPASAGIQPRPQWATQATKPPPLDLSVDRDAQFKIWNRRWESYFRLSGLNLADRLSQFDVFTSCLSDETLKIVDNFDVPASDRHNVELLLKQLAAYAKGQINESVEHHNLYQRRQEDGERFDDFLTDLRELSRNCGFCCGCLEKVLRDCIVLGVRSDDLRRLLLTQHELTLDKAVQTCRTDEAAALHQHSLSSPGGAFINRVSGDVRECGFCGGSPHARESCPAFGKKCNLCGKMGHFAKMCRAKGSRRPAKAGNNRRDGSIAAIIASTQTNRAPTVTVSVTSLNGQAEVVALPDTGADISAAGIQFLQALGEDTANLWPTVIEEAQAANGQPMTALGRMSVDLRLGTSCISTDVFIIEGISGLLLSWSVARDLSIIPEHYPLQISSVETPPTPPQDLCIPSCREPPQIPTREELMREFPTVFDGVVRVMPGEVFKIVLDREAKPFSVSTPRRVPIPYQEKLKQQLDKLLADGIITRVTEPTPWCAPIVVVPKKTSDEVRLCVDFTRLNRFVQRERYQSPTPHECVMCISESSAQVFSTFDALKGYHQCPLDEESQLLTTFITPFGRFKYLRAPYGICSISEHYNRRMDEAFVDMHSFSKLVDDVLVYDQKVEDHVAHVRSFLQRCADRGISLNPKKFVFAQPEVKFAGFSLSADGYKIHPDLTVAISAFPSPDNISDLRSFFGLVNQLSAFTSEISDLLHPLRPLLSPKSEYLWTAEHEEAFSAAKKALVSPPSLTYFNPERPLALHTDGSKLNGIGFVLKQLQEDGHWHVVQAGSRFLSPTESRYAAIELEMLAVSWAVVKCRLFLSGLPHFDVIVDHKPLVPILNSKLLHEIENVRLQRLREKIMEFVFTAHWNQGKDHLAPDALSRSPITQPDGNDELAEDDVPSLCCIVAAAAESSDLNIRLERVREATRADPVLQSLSDVINGGFPLYRHEIPEAIRIFWNVREQLTTDDGLILYGCRLVIPSSMRSDVLRLLHDSHQGIQRTKARARQVVYWPGIDNDVENLVRRCESCQHFLPAQPKEPYVAHAAPSRPFQYIHADLFSFAGQQFLVVVDAMSNWPWVFSFGHSAPSRKLRDALCEVFCCSGVADTLYSDNGPQFTSSDFKSFLSRWQVSHVTSTPYYPQSNGRAEAAVKSVKKMLRTCWDFRNQCVSHERWAKAMLQYRNTPTSDGRSPAVILYGHPVQDMVPAHRRSFDKAWQPSTATSESIAEANQTKVQEYYNAGAHALQPLSVGDQVAVQDPVSNRWSHYGVICEVSPHRRYYIRMANGKIMTRNRRFLRRRYTMRAQASPCTTIASDPSEASSEIELASETQPAPELPEPVFEPHAVEATSVPAALRRSSRDRRKTSRLVETMD